MRVALDSKGNTCRGFAFVEFENEKDANAALAANNHELKKRRIAVTIASASTKAKFKYAPSFSFRTISSYVERNQAQADTGLGRQDEIRSRSFMVKNLPPDADDGRLQQELEKVMKVKRVEVFKDKNEEHADVIHRWLEPLVETALEEKKIRRRSKDVSAFNFLQYLAESTDGGSK